MSKGEFLEIIKSAEFTQAITKTFESLEFGQAVEKTFKGKAFTNAVSSTFANEEFKLAVKEAIKPEFEKLTEEMREFRDEVLTREDNTVGELKSMRTELASYSNRVTRVESHIGLR
jgi:hypothetical protein